jgi:hypothetical protein
MKFYTKDFWMPKLWSWHVVERDGGWFCEQHSTVVMTLGADGTLGLGRPAALRAYPFLTKEWAEACCKVMEDMDAAFAPVPAITYPTASIGVTSINTDVEFRAAAKRIVTISRDGVIQYVNIPHLVWIWFRSTRLMRVLKKLWYGERRESV